MNENFLSAIMGAILDCGHDISENRVLLKFEETRAGCNALNQLRRRGQGAIDKHPPLAEADNNLTAGQVKAETTAAAKALLDAITFDDCGALVGRKFVGGNGGLISRETIKRADELRRELIKAEGGAA